MSDLIERQAAIDALVKRTHLPWEDLKTLNPMLEVLERLPSAEPEYPEWAQKVERMYNKALTKPYIKNPLAWALHEVWKEYDENG